MTIIRMLGVGAVLVGAAIGLAGTASAELTDGTYRLTYLANPGPEPRTQNRRRRFLWRRLQTLANCRAIQRCGVSLTGRHLDRSVFGRPSENDRQQHSCWIGQHLGLSVDQDRLTRLGTGGPDWYARTRAAS
jgi:hypothetical protein